MEGHRSLVNSVMMYSEKLSEIKYEIYIQIYDFKMTSKAKFQS